MARSRVPSAGRPRLRPVGDPPACPRTLILAAAERLLAERGAEAVTVTALTAAARVSRTSFYATFADREDCLLSVFDEVTDRLRSAMLAAYAAERSWLDGVRAAVRVLLAAFDAEPNVARFLILGGVAPDSALAVRRRRILAELARSLEADGQAPDARQAEVPFGTDALVCGAASIIHSRLLEDPPRMLDLSGSLMAMLVLPFVGETAARAELAVGVRARRPVSRAAARRA